MSKVSAIDYMISGGADVTDPAFWTELRENGAIPADRWETFALWLEHQVGEMIEHERETAHSVGYDEGWGDGHSEGYAEALDETERAP